MQRLLGLVFLFLPITVFAQQNIIKDTLYVQVETATYMCVKWKGDFVPTQIENVSNVIAREKSEICLEPKLVNGSASLNMHSISEVFTPIRLLELQDAFVLVCMWVDKSGAVKEVKYLFSDKKGVALTMEELFKLEKVIKGKVQLPYIVGGENEKTCSYAFFRAPINFKKLLEL